MIFDKAFHEAHKICTSLNADLASIHGADENNVVQDRQYTSQLLWFLGYPHCTVGGGKQPWYCTVMITDVSGSGPLDWKQAHLSTLHNVPASARFHAL
ncbi:hypothetical protein AAVH_21453 [Aphelenchoides avenae]|nr:hypothetical protein AAVH_21453 [Aphelenchus avenae]